MDDDRCPSATGVPQLNYECIVTGAEHKCMRERAVHPVHSCWCGSHWIHDAGGADRLTPRGPRAGLIWIDQHGRMWRAPWGSPAPGDPMPVEWQEIRRGYRH